MEVKKCFSIIKKFLIIKNKFFWNFFDFQKKNFFWKFLKIFNFFVCMLLVKVWKKFLDKKKFVLNNLKKILKFFYFSKKFKFFLGFLKKTNSNAFHTKQDNLIAILSQNLKKSISPILWNGDLTVLASQSFKHCIKIAWKKFFTQKVEFLKKIVT